MIEIKNIHKSFGENQVLNGIDFSFDEPCITAVLGPNGSGKTTLIKCVLGMVLPDQGTIKVQGADVKDQWLYRDAISYLPQIARFPENLKVSELLTMIQDLRSREGHLEELIELFSLQAFLDKPLGQLSGGTRQKVNLVLAFMYDNPILILDEPTAGLDPVAMIRLRELIRQEKEKGKTILITTHILSFMEELADHIVFLLEGNIHFKGSMALLKQRYGGSTLENAIANLLLKQNHTPISSQVRASLENEPLAG